MSSTLMDNLGAARAALGPPAYSTADGHAALYRGDCVELMRRLPDEMFDLVVTSPPYNIGKEYEHPLPLSEYVEWCATWLAEVARVVKPHGAFWLNLGYVRVPGSGKAVPLPYLLWDKVPMFLLQEVVWNYGAGVAARHTFSPRNEKFLWFVKNPKDYTFNLDAVRDPDVKYPNQKKNGKLKCNQQGKNPSDVWQIPKVTSGANRSSRERTAHPAQFPMALIDRILLACSNKGEIVLDPFAGSGSVAESAASLGRISMGFEINADYIGVASNRLKRSARLTCPELFGA